MSINNFLLEEYKYLTQEIRDLTQEARQLELYSGGAVAVLYSWFATAELTNIWVWYLPLIVPILGVVRSWAFYKRVQQISEYVKKIESHVLNTTNQPQGWETWYTGIRKHGLTPSGILFWLVLAVVCLIFPILYTMK